MSSTQDQSASSAPLLACHAVRRRFGATYALRGVDLAIQAGEVHGLCGHNGAGKSTLMHILSGGDAPDEGHLSVKGEEIRFSSVAQAQSLGIAMVQQELSIVPDLDVTENLFLGAKNAPFWRSGRSYGTAAELLARVGLRKLDPRRLAGSLSLGERQLVEVARALSRAANVLILDEPTTSLSASEAELVFNGVRGVVADGVGVVFVSHRLDEVLSLCNRVTVVRDGAVVGAHNAAELDRRRLAQLIVGELGDTDIERRAVRTGGPTRLGIKKVLVPNKVEAFAADIAAGTVVGLAGQVDSGASEVLRATAGLVPNAISQVEVDGKAVRNRTARITRRDGVVFITNDRKAEGLFFGHTIRANLVVSRLSRLATAGVLGGSVRKVARTLASRIGLRKRLPDPVSSLSGGNQQKVLIGRELESDDIRVLLIDDPTRGVDARGRADVHRLVRDVADEGRAVLFVSTDLEELLELSDEVITMYRGNVVARHATRDLTRSQLLLEMTTGNSEATQ